MQDVQIAKYFPFQGEPNLLHDLRHMRIDTVRLGSQDGFPGHHGQAFQVAPGLDGLRSVVLLLYPCESILFGQHDGLLLLMLQQRERIKYV